MLIINRKQCFKERLSTFCLVANMSQIRDKKGRKKGIETKSLINAKSVQLIELHAFACDLVCIYLSESFDFLISPTLRMHLPRPSIEVDGSFCQIGDISITRCALARQIGYAFEKGIAAFEVRIVRRGSR